MSRAIKNVLVLGAGGQIAHWVIEMLKNSDNVELTLFLRHPRKLRGGAPDDRKLSKAMYSTWSN